MKNSFSFSLPIWVFLALITGTVLITTLKLSGENPFVCKIVGNTPTKSQLETILHYATSKVVPQQSLAEISESFSVLHSLSSKCNFLVFGLGHDSLMWDSFNPNGYTLFLEEDPKWVETVLKDAPGLRAHGVKYRTKLSEADELLRLYKGDKSCWPETAYLRGNVRCKLALTGMPSVVYDKVWDVIMIDAPRGYAGDLPGRMAAIYSAAIMARNRSEGSGVTHVFLHDVDRRVERVYAEEFLCKKFLVKAVGRLWHFAIPPAANVSRGGYGFC